VRVEAERVTWVEFGSGHIELTEMLRCPEAHEEGFL